jgi:hypothetical protein
MHAILLIVAALAADEPQVKIHYHEKLNAAIRMPAVVSPDGQQLLYFSQERDEDEDEPRASYAYNLAQIDGSQSRTLYRTPVNWDGYLNALTSDHLFSADGQRVLVATTSSGQPLVGTDSELGEVLPAFCTADGKIETIKTELGSTTGFAFAGESVVFLDAPMPGRDVGYRLVVLHKGKRQTIDKSDAGVAFCLRVSPDNRRAMFFVGDRWANTDAVRVRVVDLRSGEPLDTPAFQSQDATFEGRPQLYWDAASEGMLCHVSTHPESKWPFELTHYSFKANKGVVATNSRNVGAACVLDENHVAVWLAEGSGCAVLRLADRKLLPLPDENFILGGRGRRVVVADLERDAIYAAEIELPEK